MKIYICQIIISITCYSVQMRIWITTDVRWCLVANCGNSSTLHKERLTEYMKNLIFVMDSQHFREVTFSKFLNIAAIPLNLCIRLKPIMHKTILVKLWWCWCVLKTQPSLLRPCRCSSKGFLGSCTFACDFQPLNIFFSGYILHICRAEVKHNKGEHLWL